MKSPFQRHAIGRGALLASVALSFLIGWNFGSRREVDLAREPVQVSVAPEAARAPAPPSPCLVTTTSDVGQSHAKGAAVATAAAPPAPETYSWRELLTKSEDPYAWASSTVCSAESPEPVSMKGAFCDYAAGALVPHSYQSSTEYQAYRKSLFRQLAGVPEQSIPLLESMVPRATTAEERSFLRYTIGRLKAANGSIAEGMSLIEATPTLHQIEFNSLEGLKTLVKNRDHPDGPKNSVSMEHGVLVIEEAAASQE